MATAYRYLLGRYLLGREAPYPWYDPAILLGAVGAGDVTLLVIFLTSLTGMLLFVRAMPAMGLSLAGGFPQRSLPDAV